MKQKTPLLLAICGAIGAIGAIVTTAIVAPKAKEALYEAEEEKGEELTVKERIITAGPYYIPTVLIGLGTVGCIIGGEVLSEKQKGLMAGAYAALAESFSTYKQATKEVCTEEQLEEIHQLTESQHLALPTLCRTPENDGQKIWFYEPLTGVHFERTWGEFMDAAYHTNRNFILKGDIPFSEYFTFLDVKLTDEQQAFADTRGWSMWNGYEEFGYQWVDISTELITLDDGMECYEIVFSFPPHEDYDGESRTDYDVR